MEVKQWKPPSERVRLRAGVAEITRSTLSEYGALSVHNTLEQLRVSLATQTRGFGKPFIAAGYSELTETVRFWSQRLDLNR